MQNVKNSIKDDIPWESQLQQVESTAIFDLRRADAIALWRGSIDSTVPNAATILKKTENQNDYSQIQIAINGSSTGGMCYWSINLEAARGTVLVDEWNGETGTDLGVRVLEIRFDLAAIVLAPETIADLLAEAIFFT